MGVLDFILRPLAETSDLRNPSPWLLDAIGGRKTAGQYVSPRAAMGLSTYYAVLRNISEDLAKLPLPVYEAFDETGRRKLPDHPVTKLLNRRPNPRMTAMSWRETTTHHAVGWRKGFAEIQRNGRGDPIALWPIHPDLVAPHLEPDDSLWWYVREINGQGPVLIPDADAFVIHGLGPDGVIGYSLAEQAAADLGIGLARQDFSGAFYENGTHLGGVITSTKRLSKGAADRIRQEWSETYGGAGQSSKPAVLEEGMEWKPLGIPLKDAQFIESERFGVITICRWGRMPPHKVAALDRATFSNIEHQSIEYVVDTLGAWATRWEQEVHRKLLNPDDPTRFVAHVFDALLRGDFASRVEGLVKSVNGGLLTINEARAKQEQNPHPTPEADQLLVQGAMVTLESLSAEPEPEPEPEPADPPEAPAEEEEEEVEGETPDEEELEGEEVAVTTTIDRSQVLALSVPFVRDAFARGASRQAKAVIRARKRCEGDDLEAFDAWARSFYRSQAAFLVEALGPAITSLEASLELLELDPKAVNLAGLVEDIASETSEELLKLSLEAFKGSRSWDDLADLAEGNVGPAALLARLELNLEEALEA